MEFEYLSNKIKSIYNNINSNRNVEHFGLFDKNVESFGLFNRNVEHFGMFGGNISNKEKSYTETNVKTMVENTNNIDQSMVVDGISKLINNTVNKVVSANQSKLLQAFTASNKISIAGANIKGNFTFTGINQTNTVDISGNANFVQAVQNDISTEITNDISKTISKSAMDTKELASSTSLGDMLSSAIDSVVGLGQAYMDNVGKVLDGSSIVSAGNSTDTTTITNTENNIKNAFNLNNSFKLKLNDDFQNILKNQLSTENLASCAQSANGDNAIDFSGITVDGNVNITDIKQENFVKAAMSCVFSQEIVNKLATVYFTNLENLITDMIENSSTTQTGDILAVGTAGGTVLAAAGPAISAAAQGVGSGVSTAAQGVGSGVSTAATGIGNMFSGMMLPSIICFVLLLIIGGVFAYMKMQSGKSSKSSTDGIEGIDVSKISETVTGSFSA